jgi:long-chain acyl-CoA synthetase
VSAIVAAKPEAEHGGFALKDERFSMSWAEIDPVMNRIANAMLGLGLGEEERVAVFAPNSANTVLAYVGALLAGVSSVPVNYHLTTDELHYILTVR